MRAIILTIAAVALLALPSSAGALPAAVPGAWCSTADGLPLSNCYTHEATDSYESLTMSTLNWIKIRVATGQRGFDSGALGCTVLAYAPMTTTAPGGCNVIRGQVTIHTFKRFHKYQFGKYPYIRAEFVTFTAVDGVTIADPRYKTTVFLDPQYNRPYCYADPANPYVTTDMNGAQIPTQGAPADYVAYCFPDQPAPPANETGETTTPAPVTGTCAQVTVGKKKARVVRVDLTCTVARNTIAKYLRSGREPVGWVCVKVRVARNLVGRCVKEAQGRSGRRPTVTGTYRIR